MKAHFLRTLSALSFVAMIGSFGGYEHEMFGLARCLLQMLFFFGLSCFLAILSESEYINKNRKEKRK